AGRAFATTRCLSTRGTVAGHRRTDQAAPLCPSTRHFASARHLAPCLVWKQAHLCGYRRGVWLVVIVALLRSFRRTNRHPVVGEEIVRGAIWHDDCQLTTLPSRRPSEPLRAAERRPRWQLPPKRRADRSRSH